MNEIVSTTQVYPALSILLSILPVLVIAGLILTLSKSYKNNNKQKDSYAFQYIVSFLIPLIGFILGAILLSKDNEETRSKGKTCIILGIAAVIIGIVVAVVVW